MRRALYRIGQFWRALVPRQGSDSEQRASHVLNPSLSELFSHLPQADQAHALRVLDQLQRQGETEPDLLAAALLHDVGKSRFPLAPWQRVMGWAMLKLLPRRSNHWSQLGVDDWNKPLVVAKQHARWGAEMVAANGGSERLVELIQHHHDEPSAAFESDLCRQLIALRQADDWN